VPVTVTAVPAVNGPEVGDTDVTVGAARYVNWSFAEVALVPPVALTWTSTTPAACDGAVTVNCVAEMTLTLVPAPVPKLTPVTPLKPLPVTVTEVPPANGPALGDTEVTVGAPT
jgi:hypothetical protein